MTIQSTITNAITDAVKPLSDDAQRQWRNLSQQSLSPDMLNGDLLPRVPDDADEDRLQAQKNQIPSGLPLPAAFSASSPPSITPAAYASTWMMARPAMASMANTLHKSLGGAASELVDPVKTEGPRVIRDVLNQGSNSNSENRDSAPATSMQGAYKPNVGVSPLGDVRPLPALTPVPLLASTPLHPVGQVFNRLA